MNDRYKCSHCDWIYRKQELGHNFKNLPRFYRCPNCDAPKSGFSLIAPPKSKKVVIVYQPKVADKIVEQLEKFKLNLIFGVPDNSNLPLLEAIERSQKIKAVFARSEKSAVLMAKAQSELIN
ncbi:MAG: hypothetical protein GF347_02725, partial [Candidatus Moranbacteria bacterium]|nr:hypothetical protein [Candidatus Moranbacteria bacterium]